MKVALIHYRVLLVGGLETRLFNYINYFHNRGDEVTVFYAMKDPAVVIPYGVKMVRIKVKYLPKELKKFMFNFRLRSEISKRSFDFTLSLGRTSHQDCVLAPANHMGYLTRKIH